MVRFGLACCCLLSLAASSSAIVFVNRELTGAPDCAYSLTDHHASGAEYWDPGYQNAYGSCTGLQPGPPFILERTLYVDAGATLTLQDVDLSGDHVISVESGGRLVLLDSELSQFSRLNIFGAFEATGSSFSRSLTGPAILMQGEWNASFDDCDFAFLNCGTSAILSQAPSSANPPAALFQQCRFSHSTALATLLDLTGGSIQIDNCSFDPVDGDALEINNAEEVWLRFNHFESVAGDPVRIRNTGIRELRGNTGSGNGVNAILLAVSNGTVEPAATGISTFSNEPQFPLLVYGVLSIPSAATLVLEPQTVFKFHQSAANVLVRGALRATSTVFTSNHDVIGGNTGGSGDPQPGDWEGFIIQGAAELTTPLATVELTDCTISYAGNANGSGVAIQQLSRAQLTVRGSTISYTGGDGILCQGSSGGLGSIGATIENCYLYRNERRAISFGGGDHIWTAANNVIAANGVGIRLGGATPTPQRIESNRIVGNTGEGLTIEVGGAPLIVNNVICANGLAGISKLIYLDAGGSRILNNHIYGNGGDGIRLRRSAIGAPPPVIQNTLLAQNNGYGLNEIDSSTDSAPRHVDFFGNGAGLMRRNASASLSLDQINLLAGAAGNIEADPLLTVVTQGTIDAVTYDAASGRSTLTDFSTTFGDLSGLAINPDLAQRHRYLVYSSSGNAILIEGDVTGIAAVGDAFDVVRDAQLNPATPLVNVGEAAFDLPMTDILGNARVLGSAVDIGAYELDVVVSVQEPVLADAVELEQNHPNPGRRLTEIRFRLPARQFVRLAIFDVRGRRVVELLSGEQDAGEHRATFDAGSLPAGLFFYRLDAGGRVLVRKMMLLP